MKKYKILILEDDKIQGENLKKILQNIDSNLAIFCAEEEAGAIEISMTQQIDIFFVDIGLKGSSGLDFVRKIRMRETYELSWVVFVTTHKEYLAKAFKELHCYDYILKPYQAEEIIEATRKLLKHIHKSSIKDINREFILFETDQFFSVKVYKDDIIFAEIRGRDLYVHTYEHCYKIKKMTLKKLACLLDKPNFVRSHKSFLINISYIKSINKIDSRLSTIGFAYISEEALLGYKFKNTVLNEIKINDEYTRVGLSYE